MRIYSDNKEITNYIKEILSNAIKLFSYIKSYEVQEKSLYAFEKAEQID